MKRLEIYCELRNFGRSIDLHVSNYRSALEGAEIVQVAMPLVFEKRSVSEDNGPPALSLTMQDAQDLIDQLWRCGLRPSEGSGSAGALAATQLHLKDMQTITFELLERGQPDA